MHKHTFPPRLREKKGLSIFSPPLESLIFGISQGTRGKGAPSTFVVSWERERKFFFSGTASFLRCCNFVGCLLAPEWCGGQRTRRTVWRLLLAPPLPPSLLSLYYRRLLLLLSLSQEKKKGEVSSPPFSASRREDFFSVRSPGENEGTSACVCEGRKKKGGSCRSQWCKSPASKAHLTHPPSFLPSFSSSHLWWREGRSVMGRRTREMMRERL